MDRIRPVTVVGVAMVRNEADVIQPIVRHMLSQVDEVIVCDNASDDGTYSLLGDLRAKSDRLTIVERPETGYYQSKIMSALATMAYDDFEADWIVPFDADEVWLSRDHRRIADVLAELPPNVMTAEARVWDHVATTHDDSTEANPFRRMNWRTSGWAIDPVVRCARQGLSDPRPLPKVACRYEEGLVITQGNHAAHYPHRRGWQTTMKLLDIHHFPYRSAEQFIAKVRAGAAAYAATDLPLSAGIHWRQWGEILASQGEEAIREIYYQWFYRVHPLRSAEIEGERLGSLVYDPIWIRIEAKENQIVDLA